MKNSLDDGGVPDCPLDQEKTPPNEVNPFGLTKKESASVAK
jgi:hypothetical protein